MNNKKKFEPVDHSKYCTFVSYVVIKQRCSHCGEYYNLSDRGIGAKITKDEMICLCAKCNIPYRRKTWVEKNIEAVKKEIKIIRDLDDKLWIK